MPEDAPEKACSYRAMTLPALSIHPESNRTNRHVAGIFDPQPLLCNKGNMPFLRGRGNVTNRRSAMCHAPEEIGAPIELVNKDSRDMARDQNPHQHLERAGV